MTFQSVRNRVYWMGDRIVFDSLLTGYYVTPPNPGIFNIETGELVEGSGKVVIRTPEQFAALIDLIRIGKPTAFP